MFLIIFSLILLFSSYIFYILMALLYLPKKLLKKGKSINLNQKGLIVIPVLNGSSKIESRINNICNYCDKKKFDLLIISDGSKDNTFEIANEIRKKHDKEEKLKIFVHQNKENIGRALTHNFAVQKYNYYYYVFSDLDTEFTSSFPMFCANQLLNDDKCMASSGRVSFISQKNYGRILSKLFLLEVLIRWIANFSELCMKGSGPALCIKRECWENLESYEDIDHCAGFMAKNKGGYLSYLIDSKVIDLANETQIKDLKARRRMTRKSLLSYFKQIVNFKIKNIDSFLGILGYTLHKPLRFFAFPFLIFSTLIFIQNKFGFIYSLISIFIFIFMPYIRIIKTIFLSFIFGIYDFLKLDKTGTYNPVNK